MESGIGLERTPIQRVPEIVIGSLAHDIGYMRLAQERAKLLQEVPDQAVVREPTPWPDMENEIGEGTSLDTSLHQLRDERESGAVIVCWWGVCTRDSVSSKPSHWVE